MLQYLRWPLEKIGILPCYRSSIELCKSQLFVAIFLSKPDVDNPLRGLLTYSNKPTSEIVDKVSWFRYAGQCS